MSVSIKKSGCLRTSPNGSSIVSPGLARHFERRQVQPDIDSLRDAADRLQQYASRRIAHLGREEPKEIPTFSDLDAALDVFERLVKRCRLLLRKIAGDVLPIIAYP